MFHLDYRIKSIFTLFAVIPFSLIGALMVATVTSTNSDGMAKAEVASSRPPAFPTLYKTVKVEGLDIFYREAGPIDAPVILLLHGFPTSSHMRLAQKVERE